MNRYRIYLAMLKALGARGYSADDLQVFGGIWYARMAGAWWHVPKLLDGQEETLLVRGALSGAFEMARSLARHLLTPVAA